MPVTSGDMRELKFLWGQAKYAVSRVTEQIAGKLSFCLIKITAQMTFSLCTNVVEVIEGKQVEMLAKICPLSNQNNICRLCRFKCPVNV